MRSCGKCEGCVMPQHVENSSRALGLLSDHACGYRTFSFATLLKLTRRAELDRWETEVRLRRWAHGRCVELVSDAKAKGEEE
jgi:hypothetical protein